MINHLINDLLLLICAQLPRRDMNALGMVNRVLRRCVDQHYERWARALIAKDVYFAYLDLALVIRYLKHAHVVYKMDYKYAGHLRSLRSGCYGPLPDWETITQSSFFDVGDDVPKMIMPFSEYCRETQVFGLHITSLRQQKLSLRHTLFKHTMEEYNLGCLIAKVEHYILVAYPQHLEIYEEDVLIHTLNLSVTKIVRNFLLVNGCIMAFDLTSRTCVPYLPEHLNSPEGIIDFEIGNTANVTTFALLTGKGYAYALNIREMPVFTVTKIGLTYGVERVFCNKDRVFFLTTRGDIRSYSMKTKKVHTLTLPEKVYHVYSNINYVSSIIKWSLCALGRNEKYHISYIYPNDVIDITPCERLSESISLYEGTYRIAY